MLSFVQTLIKMYCSDSLDNQWWEWYHDILFITCFIYNIKHVQYALTQKKILKNVDNQTVTEKVFFRSLWELKVFFIHTVEGTKTV